MTSAPVEARAERGPVRGGFSASLGRSTAAVCASPAILASAFLSLLAVWAVTSAFRVPATDRLLAVALAAPPAHAIADAGTILGRTGAGTSLGLAAALVLVRTISFAVLTVLLIRAMRRDRRSVPLARALARVALLSAAYLVAAVVIATVVDVLPPIGVPALSAAFVLLAFASIACVSDDLSVVGGIRRSVFEARSLGAPWILFAVMYLGFVLYLANLPIFGAVTPATPTIAMWAYGSAASLLHVVVLGALVDRSLHREPGER